MILEAILWPLGIGIGLGILVLVAALAVFLAVLIASAPFAIAVGIKRATLQYREQKTQPSLDSAVVRARSE